MHAQGEQQIAGLFINSQSRWFSAVDLVGSDVIEPVDLVGSDRCGM